MAQMENVLIHTITMPLNWFPLIRSEIYYIKPVKQFPEIYCHNSVFLFPSSLAHTEAIVIQQWEGKK